MTELPIKIERCTLTRIGAEFNPALPMKDWHEIGMQLFAIGSCYQFLIGDWLNYGEREYGEKYTLACEEMGCAYQTARNWASICARIDLSRRRDSLAFSHHEAVAGLRAKEQDEWLALAVQNKWPVQILREKIRDAGAEYAAEDHGEAIKTFVSEVANLARRFAGVDPGGWTVEARLSHKEALKPIVEFYERL